MTKSALEQTIKLLAKLPNEPDRIECIRLSIANGWQGVFPDRMPNALSPHKKPSQRNMGNASRWIRTTPRRMQTMPSKQEF